ncbi:MAG: hypothetical protein CMJ57_09585 [Planctomycetaceae bacterium]|nr:hypothetical protein [Planctomycetaceae bacterium]
MRLFPPHRIRAFACCLLIGVLPTVVGCGGTSSSTASSKAKAPPLSVTAVTAETRTVPDKRMYPGNSQAIREAVLVARIEGYLEQRLFEEGTEVSTDDLLFVIEQPPYQASVLSAQGALVEARAQQTYAMIEFERNEPLVSSGAISASEWDQIVANLEVADGGVAMAEANLIQAEINFSYTEVRAPYDGRMGQRFVDVGNLVGPGTNEQLAELVVLDPMRVVFEPAATEASDFLAAWQGGRAKVPVSLSFASHGRSTPEVFEGTLDLFDNTADTTTSTVLARAQFPNPQGTILPGTYATVTVTLGSLGSCVVIPDESIYTDPQYSYVWVIEKDAISRVNITAGVRWKGLRVVTGISAGAVVVTAAKPSSLRQGLKVTPTVESIDAWIADQKKANSSISSSGASSSKGAGS